jgi:ABC-type Co2+ transport system permease subunit
MSIEIIGAWCFGVVVGWITYRTLRRQGETMALSNIASVIAAIGGGAVTALFNTPDLFAWYCVGLFIGFFGYLILGNTVFKSTSWLGGGN